MTAWQQYGYIQGGTAGREISIGPNGGRYIDVLESLLVHPTHSDGFVDKGDPCIVNNLAGVAQAGAAAATDYISIDTEGCYGLNCTASGSDIDFGDPIYINTSTGALTNASASSKPFGIALNTTAIATGESGVIPVLVNGKRQVA